MAGIAPVVTKCQLLDAGVLDPLSLFGSYVRSKSIPRFRINTTLDPNNPDIAVSKRVMTVTDPRGYVKKYYPKSWDFTIDVPVSSGTYKWNYALTDSAGNTNQANEFSQGTFTVLPYQVPVVNSFVATRYREDIDDEGNTVYVEDEDGTKVWIDLDVNVTSVAGKNAWELSFYYALQGDSIASSEFYLFEDGEHFTLTADRNVFTDDFDIANSYEIVCTVRDVFSEVQGTSVIEKSGADFEVGPFGIGDGGRCTGTRGNPKSDFFRKSEFHGGIVGVTLYSKDEVNTGGLWIDNKPIYRKVVTANVTAVNTFVHTNAIEDVDTVVRVSSIFADTSNEIGIFSSHYYNAERYARCYYSKEAGRFRGVYWSNYYTGTAHMIVEYTKIGDVVVDPSAQWVSFMDADTSAILTADGNTFKVKED